MVSRSGNSSQPADRILVICFAILLVFGLAALMSASAPAGFIQYHDSYYFLKRQIFLGLIPGAIIFLILAKVHYQLWKKFVYAVYGSAIVLLTAIFIPGVGITVNGHHSWIKIAGFLMQPSEFAKMALIIMTAYLLTAKSYDWNDWKQSLLPVLLPLVPAFLLVVAQPDIGTLSIFVVIVFGMLWLARIPPRYLAALSGLGVVAFAALVIAAPYRSDRLTVFLHPELDPQGVGYHVNQAFLAVGSGGFWGFGYNHSRQKFQYLPEVDTDSIFAIIAEENGFIIAGGLVVLIALIGWRGLRAARGAKDEFGYLLAGGIVVWLVWQSFLNIGAMVGALPLTGVPLPFVSHGGSALVSVLAAAGILVNVSKDSSS